VDQGLDLAKLLGRLERGDRTAFDQLLPHVYRELHGLAGRLMSGERHDHTLQATGLLHEAYLKIADKPFPPLDSVRGFLGVAARAMRQVLVDHMRRRNAEKRGGGRERLDLSDLRLSVPAPLLDDLVTLDAGLRELEVDYPRCAQVVEMRVFAGLGVAEVAEVLQVTARTVERDWRFALAYLFRAVGGPDRSTV